MKSRAISSALFLNHSSFIGNSGASVLYWGRKNLEGWLISEAIFTHPSALCNLLQPPLSRHLSVVYRSKCFPVGKWAGEHISPFSLRLLPFGKERDGNSRQQTNVALEVVYDRYGNRQIRYADMYADNRILSDLLQFPHICMCADLHCICRYDVQLQMIIFHLQIMNF